MSIVKRSSLSRSPLLITEENMLTRRYSDQVPISQLVNRQVFIQTTTTINKKNSNTSLPNDQDLNNFEYSDDEDQQGDAENDPNQTITTPLVQSKHRLQQQFNLKRKRTISSPFFRFRSWPMWLLFLSLMFVIWPSFLYVRNSQDDDASGDSFNVQHHTQQIPMETGSQFSKHEPSKLTFAPSIAIYTLLNRLSQLENRFNVHDRISLESCSTSASVQNDKINQLMLDIQQVNSQLNNLKSEIDLMQEHYRSMSRTLEQMKTEQARSPTSTMIIGSESGHLQRMIRIALAKYNADKTGEADYALESAGAHILKQRCSQTYQENSTTYKFYGFTIWRHATGPRQVITSTIVPGECWPFPGSQGRFAVRLAARIVPTAFTYEHIPVRLSRDGRILSAPNHFEVYGLVSEDDDNGKLLGQYNYQIVTNLDDSNQLEQEEPLQRFPVQFEDVAKETFEIIELVVKSNHGHTEYTCLYRFRVHGKLPSQY